MSTNERSIRQPRAVLCDVKGFAKMLGLDVFTVHKELTSGKLLPPLLVCGEMRWRIIEVREWVKAGLPNRETWARRTISRDWPSQSKRTPATRPNNSFDYEFRIPKPGKSVVVWAKSMEKCFNTTLILGMCRDGKEMGCGREFADWTEPQVQAICRNVISYIRGLSNYEGQYEHLFNEGPAEPPWTLT